MHTCNPFCAAGLHAVLFTMEAGQYGAVDGAKAMGIAQGVVEAFGLKYDSYSTVNVPVPDPSNPARAGRARIVAWAKST